jgi:hypothetical protein
MRRTAFRLSQILISLENSVSSLLKPQPPGTIVSHLLFRSTFQTPGRFSDIRFFEKNKKADNFCENRKYISEGENMYSEENLQAIEKAMTDKTGRRVAGVSSGDIYAGAIRRYHSGLADQSAQSH